MPMTATSATTTAGSDVVFVAASGVDVGNPLSAGLAARGSRVALIDDAGSAAGGDSFEGPGKAGSVARVPATFGSRADVSRAFDAARDRLGPPRLVVLSVIPRSLITPRHIDQFPVEDWQTSVHGAMKAMLYSLQAAQAQMTSCGGGTIVCLGPSFGLVGAANLVALSTLLEAQRALIKSAARQWGHRGIRAHWIALGVGENYPELRGVGLPEGPELGPPPTPLGRVPSLTEDVAAIAEFLAGAGGRGLTGISLVADGGDWMVP
jgi:NAD(P)-dependent dehydrogenase (short-subunit alcohol dehydrogenase family)